MAFLQYFRDDFLRSQSPGWGQSPAPIIRTWAGSTGLSANGEYAIFTGSSSVTAGEGSVSLADLDLATSGEVVVVAAVSATGNGYGYLQLATDDLDHNAALIFSWGSSSFPASLTLTSNAGSAAAGSGLSEATNYTLRWDISKSRGTHRARIWQTASSEPATWDAEGLLEADWFFDNAIVGFVSSAGAAGPYSDVNAAHGTVTGDPRALETGNGLGHWYLRWANDPHSEPATPYSASQLADGNGGTSAGHHPGVGTDSPTGFGGWCGAISDLGAQYEVTSHVIVGDHDTASRIQHSNDGSSWTTAAGSWSGNTYALTAATVARYWAWNPHNHGANGGFFEAHSATTWEITGRSAAGQPVLAALDYIQITNQNPTEDEAGIVDLTNTVCYNNYCFGFDFPAGGGPGQGSYIRRINVSEIEAMGYEDKRALQDGFDAADVFLGRRRVVVDAAVYGSTRGAAFDEMQLVKDAFHPVSAFEADQTNLGFLPLDFFRPTADIVTWPTSAYPDGIPLRIYCRPTVPVREEYDRQKTGGIDEKGMAMVGVANLWARDPRVYLQTQQTLNLSTSTQTVTYRGDYESWPIVSFTMTAAGNSAAQIVVSGGTVKIDLSGTTTGTYEIDYANKLIRRTSDGTLFPQLFTAAFTQDFRQVKTGSTARWSATTGMSATSIVYREAFV